MTGLDLANQLQRRAAARRSSRRARARGRASSPASEARRVAAHGAGAHGELRAAGDPHDYPDPAPPDLKLHVLDDYDLDAIFPYINPVMLYTRHLGFKGKFERRARRRRRQGARAADAASQQVEDEMLRRPDIRARAVYKFFRAHEPRARRYCCSIPTAASVTWSASTSAASNATAASASPTTSAARERGRPDYVALFATTVGPGVRALAEEWKNEGEYLRSHILQVLALEGAEAFAELLHQKIREMWGFPDPPGTSRKDLFKAQLPRRARLVRLSGLPAARGSGAALPPARRRGARSASSSPRAS